MNYKWSAQFIADAVNQGELSIDEVIRYYWEKSSSLRSVLNSYIFLEKGVIDRQGKDLDSRLKNIRNKGNSRELFPLAGVPVVIKDNICTADMPTTAGSKILGHQFLSPKDAFVIERLKEAGAIIFGKANCDEFAMGSTNESSAFGPVKNPWNLDRVAGGSSGGSAACVAADMAPISLGSDTGGSVRQPASFCGVVGFKPSYGLVSRRGLIAYGSSLDQIGPLAHSVADAALIMQVIGKHDPLDSTSAEMVNRSPLSLQSLPDLKGLKFAVVDEYIGNGLDQDVFHQLENVSQLIENLGGKVTKVSIPSLKYSIASYYIIATAEASANLARYDGIRYGIRVERSGRNLDDVYCETRSEGFGLEVKKRIMLGTFALSEGYYDAYYGSAQRARRLLTIDFNKVLAVNDFLIGPSTPNTAFNFGAMDADPMAVYLSDISTIAANLVGIPAISLPCGLDRMGLPIGVQLMSRNFNDRGLLSAAARIESEILFSKKHSPKIEAHDA